MAPRLTDHHLDHLVRHGYAVIDPFLAPAELAAARANFLRYYPTPEELHATPERYAWVFEDADHLQTEFPFAGDALNDLTTHPELVGFVERALGTRQVLLSQSAIWAKYAGTGEFEQTMHLDFEGNTLVVPRDDGPFRQVNMIVYYGDVDETMGPTCVVPSEHAKALSPWPPFRPRKKWPELYRREEAVVVKAGGLLVFGMRTFHRASEIAADAGARFSHHLVYRAAGCPFNGYHQWSHFGERPELKRFLTRATPRQREVLGFPAPGHPYWNQDTLAGVAARYPGMDLTPYRAAAGIATSRTRTRTLPPG